MKDGLKNILMVLLLLIAPLLFSAFYEAGFKDNQKRYSRVRTAYSEKGSILKAVLAENDIKISELNVYMRIFKKDMELELWGKNKADKEYKLLKTYAICQSSGQLGPKRRQGDYQVPEGFYHVDAYNPASSYYLSMRINYPNKSDKILGYKNALGGNICIHGSCVTIGCVPLTDTYIKELYLFCIEAKNNGQEKIPVTVYPAKFSDEKYKKLLNTFTATEEEEGLWHDLKVAYDIFEKSHQLPTISFLPNGRHTVKE